MKPSAKNIYHFSLPPAKAQKHMRCKDFHDKPSSGTIYSSNFTEVLFALGMLEGGRQKFYQIIKEV